MSTTTKVSAAANPDLANQLAAEALKQDAVSTGSIREKVDTPPDTSVELAAGLLDPFRGLITTAEVRELNGADEEAISKASDAGKALLTILDRAVVKLGDEPATKEDLSMLLAGDRELLLLAIRRVTFGDEVNLEGEICPKCPERQAMVINLSEDVKIKKLESDRVFTVKCKVGLVEVMLPNGVTQKELVNATTKTAAELDTVVLKSCVKSINGIPVIDAEQVKLLSIKDRRDILKAISDRNPGPQLSEVSKPCKFCGSEVPLPMTLADLFQE